MSDIRKDFEEWAAIEGYYVMPQGDGYLTETQYAYEGYQAGRAHDVDGLIDKLTAAAGTTTHSHLNGSFTTTELKLSDAIEIIRKHFGKE